MSEYYAEHESIEELGQKVKKDSSELDNSSVEISASAKVIARSQTLDSLGYSNLASRTQTSVSKLSEKVRQISNIMNTVSSLYADYEGQVIAALDNSVSGGNNFSPESRYETRDADDQYFEYTQVKPGSTIIKDKDGNVYIYDYNILKNRTIELTPDAKRKWALNWLDYNFPELLEQLYDRLNNSGLQAMGVATGVAGVVTASSLNVPSLGSTDTPTSTGGSASRGAVGNSGINNVSGANGAGVADTGSTGSAGAPGGMESGAYASDGLGGGSGLGGDSVSGVSSSLGGDTGSGGGVVSGGGAGSSPDWVTDMLNDAVDAGPMQQAQDAVQRIANPVNPEATRNGVATLSDSSSMDFAMNEQSGFAKILSDFGTGFVSVVQRYGVNAGLLVGGAGAAYASSGVAIEAVAHCAEFMATKCMPGVQGFMQQAAGVARFTQVSIRSVLGGVAQGVGGLIA